MNAHLPVGPPVEPARVAPPAPDKTYTGRVTTLRPVCPDEDAAALYDGAHGSDEARALWTYMAYGPFESRDAMRAWLGTCARSTDPLFLTVLASGRPAGMASFLNIVPGMRRLELGHIWYVPASQRTRVNTDAMYLMLGEAFDALGYRRVEWKCDALNARSRAAARRLGFGFEGVFRNHMIVKGRNRDTAWYAMTDADWPVIKTNMARWLDAGEPGLSLAALNARFCRPGVEDE
jgi:RimJ/RimL family protein N-acetyltransferase